MVEAWFYAGLYTIEANGTSEDPVTPPPPSRVGGSRVCECLRRDTSSPRLREMWGQSPCPADARDLGAPRLGRGVTSDWGVWGATSGPQPTRVSRSAPAKPGRDERLGVWGAMSGPPTLKDSR